MKTNIIALLFFINIVGCGIPFDKEKEVSEITQVLENQRICWNNADVEGYMKGYWENDSLVFIGKRGLTYGYHKVLENYKSSYSNPELMGHLVFNIKKIEVISSNNGYVIGAWNLYRKTDTIHGMFNLWMKKIDGNWKIIVDHSS